MISHWVIHLIWFHTELHIWYDCTRSCLSLWVGGHTGTVGAQTQSDSLYYVARYHFSVLTPPERKWLHHIMNDVITALTDVWGLPGISWNPVNDLHKHLVQVLIPTSSHTHTHTHFHSTMSLNLILHVHRRSSRAFAPLSSLDRSVCCGSPPNPRATRQTFVTFLAISYNAYKGLIKYVLLLLSISVLFLKYRMWTSNFYFLLYLDFSNYAACDTCIVNLKM